MSFKNWFLAILTALLNAGFCLAAEAPHQLGSFILGTDISAYREQLNMDTAIPIRYAEYISEVEIKPANGFRSGLIAYGTCTNPGKVVRIKLKYADDSRSFFDELVKQIEKRYGKADDWRGDPFHIVISWKWSFTDKNNNRISMILQHNKLDTDEKIGNSIKLTLTDLVDQERECFQKKNPDFRDQPSTQTPASGSSVNWDQLVPK
ncbi:MAG: hypothetical protein WA151_01915 [Desulfatirhabdiaceae bacterium]